MQQGDDVMEKDNIQETIAKKLQSMPKNDLEEKTDSFIQQQGLHHHQKISEHMATKSQGNFIQFNDAWSPIIWQANEIKDKSTVIVNKQPVKVSCMDFYIANSLQSIQSPQSPEAEYYDWINQAKQIEQDVIHKGTTLEEYSARNNFLSMLDDRETELKRVITLYAGAAFNPFCEQQLIAQEKLKFLVFKLSELRRLRERLQQVKPRRPKQNEDLNNLQALQSNLAYNEYNHEENDDEYDNIITLAGSVAALNILHQQHQHPVFTTYNRENYNLNPDINSNQKTLDEWREKILQLSGRNIPPQPQIQKLQGFDKDLYLQLTKQQEHNYS